MLVDTGPAFEEWLRANDFLEDMAITAVEIDRSRSRVVLRGALYVGGGHAAGDVRAVRDVTVEAYGAAEVTLNGEVVEVIGRRGYNSVNRWPVFRLRSMCRAC